VNKSLASAPPIQLALFIEFEPQSTGDPNNKAPAVGMAELQKQLQALSEEFQKIQGGR
jgi:hypothetical protein